MRRLRIPFTCWSMVRQRLTAGDNTGLIADLSMMHRQTYPSIRSIICRTNSNSRLCAFSSPSWARPRSTHSLVRSSRRLVGAVVMAYVRRGVWTSRSAGDHTRQIKISTPSTGGIMKFAVKQRTCIGCKVPLQKTGSARCVRFVSIQIAEVCFAALSEKVCCKHCKPMEADLYIQQMEKIRSHETLFNKVCRGCWPLNGAACSKLIVCHSRSGPNVSDAKEVYTKMCCVQGRLHCMQSFVSRQL